MAYLMSDVAIAMLLEPVEMFRPAYSATRSLALSIRSSSSAPGVEASDIAPAWAHESAVRCNCVRTMQM